MIIPTTNIIMACIEESGAVVSDISLAKIKKCCNIIDKILDKNYDDLGIRRAMLGDNNITIEFELTIFSDYELKDEIKWLVVNSENITIKNCGNIVFSIVMSM